MAGRMFAAIDVGSFDSELVIYDISRRGGIREVDRVRSQLPIGRDTYSTGEISHEMIGEICDTLGKFRGIMDSYKASDCAAYACSAIREAKNCSVVLDQIRVRTGLTVRTANNSELRLLSLKGVASLGDTFDRLLENTTAVLDVGFGSSQLSVYRNGTLSSTENLTLGALRISEVAEKWHIPESDIPDTICELIDNELDTYRKIHPEDFPVKTLIATGESVNYMVFRGLHGDSPVFDRLSDMKNNVCPAEQFSELTSRLGHMTVNEMDEALDVSTAYADVLIPSALIFDRVLGMLKAEKVWMPGINLCDGLAADYADQGHLIRLRHNFEGDILSSARVLAQRYRSNMDHVLFVEEMGSAIFDATKKYHGMSERSRLLLRIAAILHDCGKYISIARSSENSYRIIMSTELIGLSHLERELIANVVRYNIQPYSYDDVKLESFVTRFALHQTTDEDARILIARLAAILRLANSADRSHCQKLSGCRIAVKNDRLIFTTDYEGSLAVEAFSISQKADFFEEIFGITPELRVKKKR